MYITSRIIRLYKTPFFKIYVRSRKQSITYIREKYITLFTYLRMYMVRLSRTKIHKSEDIKI